MHTFLISEIKNIDRCLAEVNRFLPYINNWATCDQLSPKVFKKHRPRLLPHITRWLDTKHEFTVRYGILMLMTHFLDADFEPEYLEWVARIDMPLYYVEMMQGWYFATALAKQREAALPYLQQFRLPTAAHNKAIQKAVESYRIDDELKTYVRTLRVKSKK